MVKQEYTAEWILRAQKIAHLGLWDQDPISNELWWSDETFRILGLEPQSVVPDFDKFLKMVHPGDRPRIIKQTEISLKFKEHPYKVDYRIITPNKSERIVYEEALIERNEKGTPIKIIGIIQDITERKLAQEKQERLIKKLQKSLSEIKTLRAILPICSFCKNIRNDDGYYEQIEAYFHKHSGVDFSHTICPKCMKKHYPEEYDSIKKKNGE